MAYLCADIIEMSSARSEQKGEGGSTRTHWLPSMGSKRRTFFIISAHIGAKVPYALIRIRVESRLKDHTLVLQ